MPKVIKNLPCNGHATKSAFVQYLERIQFARTEVAASQRRPRDDLRALARVIASLAHDSPERDAILKALCIERLSPKQCLNYAELLLNTVESFETETIYDRPYKPLRESWGDGTPVYHGLNTRTLCTLVERKLDWVWNHRIPRGKVTLINGDPNQGKTWVVLDILSRLTTGRAFPDSPNPFGEPRNALWISGEDDDEDTILPRIRMLGGDPSRIHSFDYVSSNNKQCSLNLSEHLALLDNWLGRHPLVDVVAVDPFMAFLGRIDSHRNSDVRGLMTPLAKLAAKRNIAFIGINHLSKGDGENAVYRGMGSVAFVAAARSSWLVSRDPKVPDRRLFTNVKNNLSSEKIGGLAFRVGVPSRGIVWESGTITTTANEALRSFDSSRAPQREEAKEWLREVLKTGPVAAAEVWERAKADGLCEKTVKLAKKELGVRTEKTGGTGAGWVWSIRPQQP